MSYRIVEIVSGPCGGKPAHEKCDGEYMQPGDKVLLLCTCDCHEEDE